MRKRVVSRTINMVHGTAIVITGDTVTRWELDAPEAICKDYDLLRGYAGITNGEVVKFEVDHTYTAKAVMDEQAFILASTIEVLKEGADKEKTIFGNYS